MVFAGLVVSRALVHGGAAGHDHDVPDQAAALRDHQSPPNYLPNVLMQMEAKEAGLRQRRCSSTKTGHVGEGSNMNVAFVTSDGVLKHPKFDHILSGCTSLRLLELARALQDRGLLRQHRRLRHHHRRGTCGAGDASPRQLCQGRAYRAVGCRDDWRWAAGTGLRRRLELLDEDMRKSERLIEVAY